MDCADGTPLPLTGPVNSYLSGDVLQFFCELEITALGPIKEHGVFRVFFHKDGTHKNLLSQTVLSVHHYTALHEAESFFPYCPSIIFPESLNF